MRGLPALVNPAVNVCRLFGFGLWYGDAYTMYFYDAFLLSINFALSVYSYFHVTALVSKSMPEMWDITTVLSVIRLHIRICMPPLMVILSQFHKHTLTDILHKLDDLLSPIEISYLRSFMWYSVRWLLINIIGEWITITAFQIRTNFMLLMIEDYILIIVFNCWLFIPIFHYIFIVKTVQLGMRKINERTSTIREWKESRQKWKELQCLVINLTNSEIGDIIIAHVMCRIADITFFTFLVYFYGYKSESKLSIIIFVVNVVIGVFWLFELFRQCQNCKQEVMCDNIRLILNSYACVLRGSKTTYLLYLFNSKS